MPEHHTIGLVGARGHVGGELLRLVDEHPQLRLAFAASRRLAGTAIAVGAGGGGDAYIECAPEVVATEPADVYVLALPNGCAAPYVDAIRTAHPDAALVDLSADHRFDPAWTYGLPEHFGPAIAMADSIANPGCYATAMQLAIRPVLDELAGPPSCFGVSGYSGAGTTPSAKNDPDVLRDGILPYALAGHLHEREVGHRLPQAVRFAPHVAPFFRGLSVTVRMTLRNATDAAALAACYSDAYAGHPFVRVAPRDALHVRDVVDTPYAHVGQLTIDPDDPREIGVVCVLDNLLKGAASQAVQNINLVCGLETSTGLQP